MYLLRLWRQASVGFGAYFCFFLSSRLFFFISGFGGGQGLPPNAPAEKWVGEFEGLIRHP